MHVLFAALLVIANALFAADVDGPVGTSRLVSWPVIINNGPPQDLFGAHLKAF